MNLNTTYSSQERRKDLRLRENIPVKICEEAGDIVTETQNISRSGAYCQVNRYIEPMTKMKVHFLLPVRRNGKSTSKKISCEGVVVRTEEAAEEKRYNVAIFFNDISQPHAETISDYVNARAG